jgi:hypothetical protein
MNHKLCRRTSFAVPPTLSFYFDVPLDEAVRRFQALIRYEYDQVVKECGLIRIDATDNLVAQQLRMRDAVRPHLQGAMRAPEPAAGEPLRVAGQVGQQHAQRCLRAAR